MIRIFQASIAVVLMLIVGCGGGASESTPETSEAQETPATTDPAPSGDGVAEVVIQPVGDQIKYATEEFTVDAGQSVRLVMDNIATLEAMQHNIVILAPGADVNEVGVAAMQAGPDNDYVPEGDERILFYTAMAKPGEQTVVEFTAPEEPGEYTYICTFPGHYSLMQGIMRVV